jgi:anti-sigma B factor antagonist
MPDSRYPTKLVRGMLVVAAPAEIDISNADWLLMAVPERDKDQYKTFVADMSGTRSCDPSGFHGLLRAHKRVRAKGGEVRLVVRSGAIRRVLAISGLDLVIPLFTSVDEAAAGPACVNGCPRFP